MSDHNLISISDIHGTPDQWIEMGEIVCDLTQPDIDDVVKFSNASYIHITRLVVKNHAGMFQRENAVDMNRECHHITIDEAILDEGNQNALTIKGGCAAVKIGALLITPSGLAHCDVELGGWSDQSHRKTHDIKIGSIGRTDGLPVQIRVDYASYPQIGQGNIQWQILTGIIIGLWVRLRYLLS